MVFEVQAGQLKLTTAIPGWLVEPHHVVAGT
jgi:hypothetical protein